MTAASPPLPPSTVPATATAPRPRAWVSVARDIARDRVDQAVFLASALLVGFGYSLLLPFAFTQRIAFANWHYLDARYLGFSVAFALGVAWLITLQVHAVRRLVRDSAGAGGRTGPLGAAAAVLSVLPSLLCCSPILPTLVGLIGLSASARLSTTVELQHFFATRENLLLFAALALLAASGLWSMRKLARASCLASECCAAPGEDSEPDPSGSVRSGRGASRPAGLSAEPTEGAWR